MSQAHPAGDARYWGSIGAPLATALLARVHADSEERFIEDFLHHPVLTGSQRRQALAQIARTTAGRPDLALAAHRAVAAEPTLLLEPAIEATAAASLDGAADWLRGLRDTIAEHFHERGTDPLLYATAWATVDHALDLARDGSIPHRTFPPAVRRSPPTAPAEDADTSVPADNAVPRAAGWDSKRLPAGPDPRPTTCPAPAALVARGRRTVPVRPPGSPLAARSPQPAALPTLQW